MRASLAALLLTAAGPAAASPCGPVPGADGASVSAFEAALLENRWDDMFAALPQMDVETAERSLNEIAAMGEPFTRCAVIFAEDLPPAIHRRAVAYYIGDDLRGFLYEELMETGGRTDVWTFEGTASFAVLMELVR